MASSLMDTRMAGVGVLVVLGFLYLELRLYGIQIGRHPELSDRAARYTETTRRTDAWRGEIRDRRGVTLVASAPVKTVFVNLAVCSNQVDSVARFAAPFLEMDASDLARYWRAILEPARTNRNQAPQGLLVRRNVRPAAWDALTNAVTTETFGVNTDRPTRRERARLRQLRARTFFARDDQMRVAPYTNLLGPVLGFVVPGLDGIGLEAACGVEKSMDRVLAGVPGVCVSGQDAAGNELPFRRSEYRPPVDGDHVVLTIDLRVQQIAEAALAEAVAKHSPRTASVLVLQPQTGEILGWAAYPSSSPQEADATTNLAWRVHAVADRMEPGSTLKVLTLAAALNERIVTLDQRIGCENGLFRYQDLRLRDHAPYGWLTIRDAFAKSSNIAFAKLAILLGSARLHQYLTNFGLTELTGVPVPGEIRGYVPRLGDWNLQVLSRAGIGQGVALTQLELAMAVASFATEGRLMRPVLVRGIQRANGELTDVRRPTVVRTVVSPAVAREVLAAMQAVVSPQGTGAQAALSAHSALGKTGTAQKATPDGYVAGRYYASFVGLLPAERPQLLIAVALDEPRNGYYGGSTAAPVFRSLGNQIAPLLGIPPDKATVAAWFESEDEAADAFDVDEA